jgi:hypothetical protein
MDCLVIRVAQALDILQQLVHRLHNRIERLWFEDAEACG